MVPDNDILDLPAHKAQAQARGYTVLPADTVGMWRLMSPLHDYRGSFHSIDDAWRAAPRDRRLKPRAAAA
jgi:hypothetical protein